MNSTQFVNCSHIHMDFPIEEGAEFFKIPLTVDLTSQVLAMMGCVIDLIGVLLVVSRSSAPLRIYKYYMLCVQIIGLCTTIYVGFLSRIAIIRMGGGIFYNSSGLLSYFGITTNTQQIVTIGLIFGMYAGYLNCFLYRYRKLREADNNNFKGNHSSVVISILVYGVVVIPVCVGFYWNNSDYGTSIKYIVQSWCLNPYVRYIGLQAFGTFALLLVCSLFLTLLTYRNLNKHLKKDVGNVHRSLLNTLILQACVPLLTAFVPYCVSLAAGQSGFNTGEKSFTYFYSLVIPLISSQSTLTLILRTPPYRTALRNLLGLNTVHTATPTTKAINTRRENVGITHQTTKKKAFQGIELAVNSVM